MKAAKKVPVGYELTCPHCAETIMAPCGAVFWTVTEMQLADKRRKCEECGRAFILPLVKD